LVETRLDSNCDPPFSTSWVTGIAGVSHHTQHLEQCLAHGSSKYLLNIDYAWIWLQRFSSKPRPFPLGQIYMEKGIGVTYLLHAVEKSESHCWDYSQ
jgi:hypothetical protein